MFDSAVSNRRATVLEALFVFVGIIVMVVLIWNIYRKAITESPIKQINTVLKAKCP